MKVTRTNDGQPLNRLEYFMNSSSHSSGGLTNPRIHEEQELGLQPYTSNQVHVGVSAAIIPTFSKSTK